MRNKYILVAFAFAPLLGMAQLQFEAGLFLGVSNYQGDLTLLSTPRLSESNLAIGLLGRAQLDPLWGLRANLFYGKLSGDDNNYRSRMQRGFSFETTLVELSVVGEWEPLRSNRYQVGNQFGQRLSPYLFGGLGLAFIDVRTNFASDSSPRAVEDRFADYSNVQFSIPMGLGMKIGIDERWTIGLEFGTRATFTDYLDGVSKAGLPETNDWYLFGGITLVRTL